MRVFIIVCVGTIVLASCAPAPKLDPTPLVCPNPFLRLASEEPANALATIHERLEGKGFVTENYDANRLSVLMSRRSVSGRDAYDRFLIWVERDRDKPLEYVQIYVMYGKYITVIGSGEPIRRQWIDPAVEAQQLKEMRDILTAQ
jgi:hypothetical protein